MWISSPRTKSLHFVIRSTADWSVFVLVDSLTLYSLERTITQLTELLCSRYFNFKESRIHQALQMSRIEWPSLWTSRETFQRIIFCCDESAMWFLQNMDLKQVIELFLLSLGQVVIYEAKLIFNDFCKDINLLQGLLCSGIAWEKENNTTATFELSSKSK